MTSIQRRYLSIFLPFLFSTNWWTNEATGSGLFLVRPRNGDLLVYSPIGVNATLHCVVNSSKLEWDIDGLNFEPPLEGHRVNLRQIYEGATTTSGETTTYSSVIIFGDILRNNGTMVCCRVLLGQDLIKDCTVLIVYDRPSAPENVLVQYTRTPNFINISWTASLTHQVWKHDGEIRVNISSVLARYCSEYPLLSYLLVLRSKESGMFVNTSLHVNETEVVLSHQDGLEDERKYAINNVGMATTNENIIYSTDVQFVNATVTGESTIDIQCWFIHGSDARGCKAVLVSEYKDEVVIIERNNDNVISASGTFNLTYPVSCYSGVLAFDFEHNTLSNPSIEQKLQPRFTLNTRICSGLNSKCTTGNYPYKGDQSNDCNGMCGLRCQCWPWVCGDCCVHQGCLDHDNYCARDGYFSYNCTFGLLRFFSCSGYSLQTSRQRQFLILLFFLFFVGFYEVLLLMILIIITR